MKTILVDAVGTLVIEGKGLFQEMYRLLASFPNKKIVLTGANDAQCIEFGLDKVPYEVFTLKHQPEKTDPAYYQTLLKTYALDAADVIYFEHNPAAVASAQAVGITSYYYDPETKDLTALKDFLITQL